VIVADVMLDHPSWLVAEDGAATQGLNVGVLDAEAHGLGIAYTTQLVSEAAPRWAGPRPPEPVRLSCGLSDDPTTSQRLETRAEIVIA
jgi:hypothetical protein